MSSNLKKEIAKYAIEVKETKTSPWTRYEEVYSSKDEADRNHAYLTHYTGPRVFRVVEV